MSSTALLGLAGIVSVIIAFAANKLARRQGRNPVLWTAACFVLPALILFLMKEGADQHMKQAGD